MSPFSFNNETAISAVDGGVVVYSEDYSRDELRGRFDRVVTSRTGDAKRNLERDEIIDA